MKNTLLAALVLVATLAPSTAWAAHTPIFFFNRIPAAVCEAVRMPMKNPNLITVGVRDLVAAAFGCPLA